MIIAVILIPLLTLSLGADIYMKTMQRMKPFEMMGKKQNESVEIKEQWLAKNKFAQTGKEFSLIVDYDKQKLYLLVHAPRVYYEVPTDFNREELLNFILGIAPKAAEIIKSIEITDAKVNLSGETKKIANWNCRSSEFEMVVMIPALNMMPRMKMKMWLTEDLPSNYKGYTKTMDEFFAKSILGLANINEKSRKELEKLDKVEGFEVASEMTVNIFGSEINIESQCLEVTEKPAPPGTYSVPKGYLRKGLNYP
jgi:hypothetical protein